MRIIVKGKPLRYNGKLYRTGDAANVSRQHARVLTAIKRAELAPEIVEKPLSAPAPSARSPSPSVQTDSDANQTYTPTAHVQREAEEISRDEDDTVHPAAAPAPRPPRPVRDTTRAKQPK